MKEMKSISIARNLDVVGEFDVLIAGGGMAGTSAAIMAARSGARVVLIERFGELGGNGTVGGVRGFCGQNRGQGEIFDNIIQELEKFNAVGPLHKKKSFLGARWYDHGVLSVVLQELALAAGVDLMLHTQLVDCTLEDGKIKHVVIAGKSGLEAIAGKQFIDCTGEADLVARAGFQTNKGRPEDGMQLPMSIIAFLRKRRGAWGLMKVPRDYVFGKPIVLPTEKPMTSFSKTGTAGRGMKVKVPGFDATSTTGLLNAEIEGRRKILQVLHHFQQIQRKNWELDHFSPIIGIREGRRAVGEHVLSVEEVREGTRFPDAIAVGTYPLDAHDPTDDKRTYILSREEMRVPPYQIPLRSLIPKGSKNLLVAGRCISADQLALSSARVLTTCAMTGQAAGITAAKCALEGISPMELFNRDPGEIGRSMVERGAKLDLGFYSSF